MTVLENAYCVETVPAAQGGRFAPWSGCALRTAALSPCAEPSFGGLDASLQNRVALRAERWRVPLHFVEEHVSSVSHPAGTRW